jgi:ABC-type spermidine/putrescine transport system permease subunit I
MIGNKIAKRTFADRNLPHASGLASILAVLVLTPVIVYQLRTGLMARRYRERRQS